MKGNQEKIYTDISCNLIYKFLFFKSSEEHSWMDDIIEECLALDVKPVGIMKIINRFILSTDRTEKCIAVSTVRRHMDKLLKKKASEQQNTLKKLTYLGFDGRKGEDDSLLIVGNIFF